MKRCIGCRFYDRNERASVDGGELRWGRCRRSVPVLHSIAGRASSTEGVWPQVRDDDWCGEWQACEKRLEDALPASRDSLLDAAASHAEVPAQAPAAGGPRESLMIPVDSPRASPSANHYSSD